MSMTPEQMAIVKSTVPILEQGGVALTTYFYNKMFSNDSSVRPFFNQTHQGVEKSQPKALAYSVLCVARHIDQIAQYLGTEEGKHLINTIVTKHIAVQVMPEHYPIVGKYLLESIREVLGPEVATDAVIDAYAAMYGILADLLIGLEKTGYAEIAELPGGWVGQREFVIVKKDFANAEQSAINWVIQSKDKKEVMDFKPGQYLTLRLVDAAAGIDTTRNYSISNTILSDESGVKNMYQFTTQVFDKGLVTQYLKNHKAVGDSLMVHPITGEFTLRDNLKENDDEIVFVAAGSGVTPFIPMAKAAKAANPDRKVTLVHICQNAARQFFPGATAELKEKYGVNVVNVFTRDAAGAQPLYTKTEDGQEKPTDALYQLLQQNIPAQFNEANIYLVGPRHFMLNFYYAMAKQFPTFTGNHINIEAFGPHPSIDLMGIQARLDAEKAAAQ